MEQVTEFKYVLCIFNVLGTGVAECRRKKTSGRKVAGAMKCLVNVRGIYVVRGCYRGNDMERKERSSV